MSISIKIKSIFNNGDERSSLVRKNILVSAIMKGIGLLTSFFMVSITLDYLSAETYGVWLTLSSILYWFTFFDIGLGNGMRNYLSAALSIKDYKLAKEYISTTFILVGAIAFILSCIITVFSPFIDVQQLFNTSATTERELLLSLIIAVIMTLIVFTVRNVGTIFMAMQKSAVNDVITTMGNVVSLIIILLLSYKTEGRLVYIVIAFTTPTMLIYLMTSFYLFIKYKELCPSFKSLNWGLSKKIVGKGLGFFFIQITSCLVIYGSSNIFITQFCGPTEVTNYNIAYKYFNLLAVAYVIYMSPFWNAYTDAYVKGNNQWISTTFHKTLKVWCISVLVGGVMLVIAPYFYYFWVGDTVKIPMMLSLFVFLYISMYNLNNCFTYLINGLNKIRIQIFTSIIITAIYLFVVNIVGRKYGAYGVIGCMISSYLIMALIHYRQCSLLIKGKAKNIWNK